MANIKTWFAKYPLKNSPQNWPNKGGIPPYWEVLTGHMGAHKGDFPTRPKSRGIWPVGGLGGFGKFFKKPHSGKPPLTL